jgi:hypothetical protein
MSPAETIIAAVLGLLVSGGGAKFFFDWLTRRQKAQHDHDLTMAANYDRHQAAFLAALKELSDREEVRREKHLADARTWSESLRDMASRLTQTLDRVESRRPPAPPPKAEP